MSNISAINGKKESGNASKKLCTVYLYPYPYIFIVFRELQPGLSSHGCKSRGKKKERNKNRQPDGNNSVLFHRIYSAEASDEIQRQ